MNLLYAIYNFGIMAYDKTRVDNYLLLDADMLVSEQMASLATYFGLGQQTHRYFYRLQGVMLLALALK